MSDLESQIAQISQTLTGLRGDDNYNTVTNCLRDLEDVRKRIHQINLVFGDGSEELETLKAYEKQHQEDQRIISRLAKEIEFLTSPDDPLGEGTTKKLRASANETIPLRDVTNVLKRLEIENIQSEKLNEINKSKIRQLRSLNNQNVNQITSYEEQIEELNKIVKKLKDDKALLYDEKDKLIQNLSESKAGAEFFKERIDQLENQADTQELHITSLKAKLKKFEHENRDLVTTLSEVAKERKTLIAEKTELADKFQAVYEELLEDVNKQKANLEDYHTKAQGLKPVFNSGFVTLLKTPLMKSKSTYVDDEDDQTREEIKKRISLSDDLGDDKNKLVNSPFGSKEVNENKFESPNGSNLANIELCRRTLSYEEIRSSKSREGSQIIKLNQEMLKKIQILEQKLAIQEDLDKDRDSEQGEEEKSELIVQRSGENTYQYMTPMGAINPNGQRPRNEKPLDNEYGGGCLSCSFF